MKVLVADDDVTSRRILSAILGKWGYEPIVVEDGRAAMDALEQPDAPRLALLDWNMPGLEGPEVCRRLRLRDVSDPPYLLLLTARGSKDDIVRGLDAGANDYVAKPYDSEELRARIRVGTRMLELQADLVKARDDLAYQAAHAALTGIPNRRAILETLDRELARAGREGVPLSIGMCDIDHFKRVNDTFGHPVGDEVLIAFAQRARVGLRAYDSVGRYGGEEFLILAPGTRGVPEDGLYERLCARTATAPISTAAGPVSITVSIGVARSEGDDSSESMLVAADAALYQAKAAGRNRVCYAGLQTAGAAPG